MTELLSFLQLGSINDSKDLLNFNDSNKTKLVKFPGSRNEEFNEILGRFQRTVELKSDWIISEGLLDALVALIAECESLSDSKLRNTNRRREVDVTYFDDEALPKISTDSEELKKYLQQLSSGILEIEVKSSSKLIGSSYHLQKLALAKLEALFYNCRSEVSLKLRQFIH